MILGEVVVPMNSDGGNNRAGIYVRLKFVLFYNFISGEEVVTKRTHSREDRPGNAYNQNAV